MPIQGRGQGRTEAVRRADLYVLVLGYGERGWILRPSGDPCGVMDNAIERGDIK